MTSAAKPAAQHPTVDPRFVGTWRLISLDAPTRRPEWGPHPKGLIYYDATRHMAAQLAPDRARQSWPPNAPPSPQQALDAVSGSVAYFGTYIVDQRARTVTHRREGALNLYEGDIVRHYEFPTEDRLVLTPLEKENAGVQLGWERLR